MVCANVCIVTMTQESCRLKAIQLYLPEKYKQNFDVSSEVPSYDIASFLRVFYCLITSVISFRACLIKHFLSWDVMNNVRRTYSGMDKSTKAPGVG